MVSKESANKENKILLLSSKCPLVKRVLVGSVGSTIIIIGLFLSFSFFLDSFTNPLDLLIVFLFLFSALVFNFLFSGFLHNHFWINTHGVSPPGMHMHIFSSCDHVKHEFFDKNTSSVVKIIEWYAIASFSRHHYRKGLSAICLYFNLLGDSGKTKRRVYYKGYGIRGRKTLTEMAMILEDHGIEEIFEE